MSRLRAEPPVGIADAAEARALAAALWRQAAELYSGLAARMAELGCEDARAAFARIEADARRRADAEPSARADAEAPPVFEHEDLGASRLVTAYDAHALAARNVERAFAFWSYASAHAEDGATRAEVERQARDLRARLKELRAARRRAFHEARARATDVTAEIPPREALRAASLAEFRAEAARREAALAALHGRVAQRLATENHPAATELRRIAREEADLADELGGCPATSEPPSEATAPATGRLLARAVARLEAATEFYLAIAEHSRHEAVVDAAQRLARHAIDRLSRLR